MNTNKKYQERVLFYSCSFVAKSFFLVVHREDEQMARLKPQAKVVLIVVLAGGVVFGLRSAMQHGWIPTPGIIKSIVATRVDLPPQTEAQVANVQASPYPSTVPANVSATRIPIDI